VHLNNEKHHNTPYFKRVFNFFSKPYSLIIASAFLLSSCYLSRLVVYNFSDIKDYQKFEKRTIKASEQKFQFAKTISEKKPKKLFVTDFDAYLKKNKTVGFLVIQNDSIQYERYFNGYDKESIVSSMSITKSIVSILIGCAVEDGLIQSINEPITNYIPELKKNGFDKVTIKHLLQMTSGIDFNENYFNPFGEASVFYYGFNLREKLQKMKLVYEPGTKFKYTSGNPQLLGYIIDRALKGKKTLSQYLQEKIWIPLGMEYDAYWSIDQEKNALEKTFCCLDGRVRDFAKIGRLYLNKGNWNGKQIVSEKWVEESTKIDTTDASVAYYQYQWWQLSPGKDFIAAGHLGQFVYVNPAKNLLIIRFGKNYGKIGENAWEKLIISLSDQY
jgi:CubicO group peptidase (beta-lactamase class C family)